MTGRVVLFGATGFTGRLAAEAMTRAGLAPVLAGRSPDALVDLTGELAGLGPMDAPPTWRSADSAEPESVRALVTSADDVLVSTVGPFTRLGRPALDAAVEQGCSYLDSTGEGPFIQEVFEQHDGPARATGARLLTAFGYDYVPGTLAAALAIREARDRGRIPVSIQVGYFTRGPLALSSGTRASATAVAGAMPYALHNGRLVATTGSVATFDLGGTTGSALPVGTSEPFTLPRLDPGVRDVDVYLGWAGVWTRPAHAAATVLSVARRVPLIGPGLATVLDRAGGQATGRGPTASERAGTSTVAVARAQDGVGRTLSTVRVEGPSPYDLTAELLAWGAAMLVTGHARGTGALGPADAFGLDALIDGCAGMGLHRVG